MSNKEIDVFIQNLKDKTTVLQQLIVCIDECKKIIGYTDQIKQMCEDLDIDSANSKLNELDTTVGNLIETVENLNTTINGENGLVNKVNSLDDTVNTINNTINGEDGLASKVNAIDEAINGEDGISEKIGELEEGLEDLAETVSNNVLYRYQLGLSFEDDDDHSYYVELNIICNDIGDTEDEVTYNDLIGLIYLGQPCYESDRGDPCFIYGISSSDIEFQFYDGSSFLADATPDNLACTILSKQEL